MLCYLSWSVVQFRYDSYDDDDEDDVVKDDDDDDDLYTLLYIMTPLDSSAVAAVLCDFMHDESEAHSQFTP